MESHGFSDPMLFFFFLVNHKLSLKETKIKIHAVYESKEYLTKKKRIRPSQNNHLAQNQAFLIHS